jgi:hypothetical protein
MTSTLYVKADEPTIPPTSEPSSRLGVPNASGLRYEIIGRHGAPVVAVLGGISASKHVASS